VIALCLSLVKNACEEKLRVVLNDIHSELNASEAVELVSADSLQVVRDSMAKAYGLGIPLATAGGRCAMGGQQFCNGGLVLDTRKLDRVLRLDLEHGLVEVEAGIQWPALIDYLESAQACMGTPWAIAQKQTGADRISIGGTISANAHGRGLSMRPFISDVESLRVVNARGEIVDCDRTHNAELFSLVAGGYGLFGCIYSATLRLVPRKVLERIVQIASTDELESMFKRRIEDSYIYGDFQFATDPVSDDFLNTGVFSCYRPTDRNRLESDHRRELSTDDWRRLITLAHTDKSFAFKLYSEHYLATSGQLYYSDRQQLANYEDGYHRWLDEKLCATHKASEMITELYVPRASLGDFMTAVAKDFRKHDVDLIYGTIRLIERDDESFLSWARKPWACIIFNLHTVHTFDGIARSAAAFQRLIDLAIEREGSYYLTYHRWARRDQIERCYPQIRRFLELKREYDPDERFQSDWYRHVRDLFFEV
jgi:FAD/FMN-containing dehydrogenase